MSRVVSVYSRFRWEGALMVAIQSDKADLNSSRVDLEVTEFGSEFQVLIVLGKNE